MKNWGVTLAKWMDKCGQGRSSLTLPRWRFWDYNPVAEHKKRSQTWCPLRLLSRCEDCEEGFPTGQSEGHPNPEGYGMTEKSWDQHQESDLAVMAAMNNEPEGRVESEDDTWDGNHRPGRLSRETDLRTPSRSLCFPKQKTDEKTRRLQRADAAQLREWPLAAAEPTVLIVLDVG
ncbi:PREDICTED: uncharacterized protein LOC108542823 [Rhinopithecus bieti]|uniref:uncharacterized protein LOC108542823 n=1 Tax=Rhinopithecus bieti TaxID=61621 RepID=UPI00083BE18E|nr:PREDICTED: uncharacterized protein LOC108542823 [Rhinopithecus bieti]